MFDVMGGVYLGGKCVEHEIEVAHLVPAGGPDPGGGVVPSRVVGAPPRQYLPRVHNHFL